MQFIKELNRSNCYISNILIESAKRYLLMDLRSIPWDKEK